MAEKKEIPSSVLIIGSGVFGLSTAYELAQRPGLEQCRITLVERVDFPAPDAASVDSSRIVRPDYADGAYAALMAEAHPHWRGEFGADGRYTEAGLCIVTDDGPGGEQDAGAEPGYTAKAFETVKTRLGLKVGRREDGGQIEPLNSAADVRRIMASMGGDCGRAGYVNWTSGWADAEAAMRHMRRRLAALARPVEWRTAEVRRLHYDAARGRVEGVELASGERLTAALVVLAAGAWTPRLVDLRGVASATGQVMAYLRLTPAEQARLGGNPTLICETSGMFIIPPRAGLLKVARHGYGYANPVAGPHPERAAARATTASRPRTHVDDPALQAPAEGLRACRDYLARTNPALAARPWARTRLCWYTDTPTGDWLVTYHPAYANLFLATGGSGHAFKFLPVVGRRVVDVMLGHDRDALGAELRRKWEWPQQRSPEDHVCTADWRGGEKGMLLDDELDKSVGVDMNIDGTQTETKGEEKGSGDE